MYSQHQAQYFAWQLTRRLDSEDQDKLTGAIMDAQIDLNPHQVDAALFAFRNPLSNGVILADEVGLGKTIEAGLVIAQKWAERKRRVLIITPANLRKQWYQELKDKFGMDGVIIEGANYKKIKKEGVKNPFDVSDQIVICSYQFAKAKAADIQLIPWDLAVIDEAHRLRNVYKKGNVIAKTINDALSSVFKVMLTATPLQNSLLELFGMVSIIDEKIFGDLDSFRIKYATINNKTTFGELRQRVKSVCKRTLRKDVEAYVPYTKRIAMVEAFTPSSDEQKLYKLVAEYLGRQNLHALPNSQRQLISMVLWKLLASSSFAIASALGSIIERLQSSLDDEIMGAAVCSDLNTDYETLNDTAEEWSEDSPVNDAENKKNATDTANSSNRHQSIIDEINELRSFKALAENIRANAKGDALLKALKIAFEKLKALAANEKAIIFTESRKTQNYLFELLAQSEHKDDVILFNGSNDDKQTRQIYQNWLVKHKGSDSITGSKTADTRAALVEYFKNEGKIMIATEAAAEGINLQFCSLVINYDLPWNPQRIEQRIGRCHRYGQKYDVVVLNFIDTTNPADQRVYELLSQKFKIFDGVFGASDEVLGAIENGVDFERRIKEIYDTCRNSEDIKNAFDRLQQDLAHEINVQMVNTREKLFEHFDEDVLQHIKIQTEASLDKYEQMLLALTQTALANNFAAVHGGFFVKSLPPAAPAGIPLGLYELPRRAGDGHLYRLKHPLAQWAIENAKRLRLEQAHLVFDTDAKDTKVSVVEQLKGQSGQLQVCRLTIESMNRAEDHLAVIGLDNHGELVHSEVLEKLLSYPIKQSNPVTFAVAPTLDKALATARQALLGAISQRNLKYFETEVEKLDTWADDLKVVLEQDIKETDREIHEVRRTAKLAPDLHEKLHWQKRQKELEKLRNKKRRELFARQDEVDERREHLITELEDKMNQTVEEQVLFSITWEVV